MEAYKRAVDAFNDRDLETWIALSDPEIELAPLSTEMEGGIYRGHDGVRRFWADYLAVFPDFGVEWEEVRDLGDVTLARARLRGHGTESAAAFEQPIWQVVRWRDRRCVWWHSYRNEADALDAAGLSE